MLLFSKVLKLKETFKIETLVDGGNKVTDDYSIMHVSTVNYDYMLVIKYHRKHYEGSTIIVFTFQTRRLNERLN